MKKAYVSRLFVFSAAVALALPVAAQELKMMTGPQGGS